jgi:hypothetical protein
MVLLYWPRKLFFNLKLKIPPTAYLPYNIDHKYSVRLCRFDNNSKKELP